MQLLVVKRARCCAFCLVWRLNVFLPLPLWPLWGLVSTSTSFPFPHDGVSQTIYPFSLKIFSFYTSLVNIFIFWLINHNLKTFVVFKSTCDWVTDSVFACRSVTRWWWSLSRRTWTRQPAARASCSTASLAPSSKPRWWEFIQCCYAHLDLRQVLLTELLDTGFQTLLQILKKYLFLILPTVKV